MAQILRLTKVIERSAGEWSAAQTLTTELVGYPDLQVFINIKYKVVYEDTMLDLNEVGLKIVDEIKSLLYNSSGFNSNPLKDAVFGACKKFSNPELIIAVCCAACLEGTIHLAAFGGAIACLFRNNSFVKLLESSGEGVSASGQMFDGDWYVLSQKELFEKFDEQRIKKALSTNDESYIYNYFSKNNGFSTSKPVSIAFLRSLNREINPKNLTVQKNLISKVGWPTKYKLNGWTASVFEKVASMTVKNKDETVRSRKSAVVGVFLIITLLALAVYGSERKKTQNIKLSYASALSEAQYKFDEALRLADLDKSLSQKNFSESEKLIEDLNNRNIEDAKLTDLENKIDTNRGRILGLYEASFNRFLDLGLIKENFNASEMTLSNGKSFVSDVSNNAVIKISLDDKRSEIVGKVDKESNIFRISSYFDSLFVFSDSGLFKIEEAEKQKIDEEIPKDILTHSYAGNVYFVEKNTSAIWRYTPNMEGYSDRKSWLSESNKVDLSQSVEIAIDGSVWILSADSKISILTSGTQRTFNLGNFPQIKNVHDFYTDESTEKVYLLDKQEGAIAAVTKDGLYVSQYISPKIKEAVDFVVYEKQQKIFLLTKNEILFSDLAK